MSTQHTVGAGGGQQATGDVCQYVTFMLAAEEYGIDILRVQEIRGWEPVTPIPRAPSFVRGVMNLRGDVVPVVDMRQRFDLEPRDYGPTTVVVVVKVSLSDDTTRTVGLVVDAISEVYDIAAGQSKATPDIGCAVDTEFVKGIATIGGKMVILLDVDHLVGTSVFNRVRGQAA